VIKNSRVRLSVGSRQLLLLAPAATYQGCGEGSVETDRHEDLLRRVQRLRGSVYLDDGAIGTKQLTDGRHVDEGDLPSWHLLVVSEADEVLGCVRYRKHQAGVAFSELTAAQSSLVASATWGRRARAAIDEELALSRSLDLPFVEIGGWALDPEIRGTVEALRMVLGIYAISREMGGAIGLATATTRHSSSTILRRIGGHSLMHAGEELPPYTDEHYDCQMELLRFYSWAPNPRYDTWVHEMRAEISSIPVICSAGDPMHRFGGMRHQDPGLLAVAC